MVPLLRVELRTFFLLREATLPICPQGHHVLAESIRFELMHPFLNDGLANRWFNHSPNSPYYIVGPFPFLKPTSPPSSLIRLITSSKRIGLKSVCSTQTQ